MSVIAIERRGSWSTLRTTPEIARQLWPILDRRYSWRLEGVEYVEAFRAHRWDGRVHVLQRKLKRGEITMPSGLVGEVLLVPEVVAYGLVVDDRRATCPLPVTPAWTGHRLRVYQQEAVDAACNTTGGGIIRVPTRGGKTLIAAAIIARLAQRTLFVVPSRLLLSQTAKALAAALGGVTVTAIGEGLWDGTGDVVVATVQTLTAKARSPALEQLCEDVSLCFLDEIHHLRGKGSAWRDMALGLDAGRKIGLSATVDLSKRRPAAEGAVWLRAICGPLLYSARIADLMAEGFLVPCHVRFVRHGAPDTRETSWTSDLYDRLVVQCRERNDRIVAEAVAYARAGERVLVDVSRIDHARLLADAIDVRLPRGVVHTMIGRTGARARSRILEAVKVTPGSVIVGTIMGEGVDVPELTVVVNAEGGKAKVSTIQRLRNLTASAGKTGATVVEMADDHHPILAGWTLDRLAIYQAEPGAFTFEFEGQ